MPQSLARVLVHIIFSTKDRFRFIKPQVEKRLFAYIATVLRGCGSVVFAVDGDEDHAHILCSLPRTMALSRLLEEVKKRSSRWMKELGGEYRMFAWQSGYGAFSVGESGVKMVKRYISGQKEHHRSVSFQDEFRQFLRRYRVDFDERYVWG